MNKEFYTKLQENINEKIDKMFSDEKGIGKLANVISKISSQVAVIALEEYEKLKNEE